MARYSKSQKVSQLADKALVAYNSSKNFFQEIDQEKQKALAYYMQLPMGTEAEGFSSFITSDVRDTVKWYLQQLIDMFLCGTAPVRFNARNEQDAEQAEIETEYVNYVIRDQNMGFLTVSNWFQDALIMKNGIVKVFWDNRIDKKPEEYENKIYEDVVKLVGEKEFEITRITVRGSALEGSYSYQEMADLLENSIANGVNILPDLMASMFDVKGFRVADLSQVAIQNCQPENFFVDLNWTSLDLNGCPYVGYRTYRTRADLIEDGYDYDMVMSLPQADLTGSANIITATRYARDTGRYVGSTGSVNVAAQYVEFVEHYIVDFDGKEPQLWCLKTGTASDTVFEAYEIDRNPFCVITPLINPYRFYGDSIADELIDIQYARSNLYRAAFDNIKYTVAPQRGVKGDVDIDQLNNVQPLGTVNMGTNGEVMSLTTPFVASSALEFAGLLEGQRAERTGFSKDTAGLNPSALADSTNMMGAAILNLSQSRVKFVATNFAMTGYKLLCEKIRELLCKYEQRDVTFAITGKYITLSPRSWVQNRSTSVDVGLGYAGKDEKRIAMQNILQLQEKIIAAEGVNGALLDMNNVYNSIKGLLESVGIKNVSSYFKNPEGYQPPAPQPTLAELQLKSYEEIERYKVDKNTEVKMAEIDANIQTDAYKVNMDASIKERELSFKYQDKKAEDVQKLKSSTIPKK